MRTLTERTIHILSGDATLEGILEIPEDAQGIVLFAHGSGSGRYSPRNQYVARTLREAGIGTLLFDLLEGWESEDTSKVFNIDLLAERLLSATGWVEEDQLTDELPIGYFGASTGSAAALEAASKWGSAIKAVVSRGGRPDLAIRYLPDVTAATLLIVGGNDWPVISMNQEAYQHLPGIKKLEIVPGATHLFEEPGTLEKVAHLAKDWFAQYLVD